MTNTLHIYGQKGPHYNVEIAGDRSALERLILTIEDALSNGQEGRVHYTNDGEEYTVYVSCYSEEGMQSRHLPYSDKDY